MFFIPPSVQSNSLIYCRSPNWRCEGGCWTGDAERTDAASRRWRAQWGRRRARRFPSQLSRQRDSTKTHLPPSPSSSLLSSSKSTSSAADAAASLPPSAVPSVPLRAALLRRTVTLSPRRTASSRFLWTLPDVDVRPQVGGSLALKKKPKTVEAGGGQVVAVSRRANSKCHSAAAPRDGSQSVGTLTRNQRKLDFNCREYKVPLSRPRCRLLLLLFFFFRSAAALQLSEPPHQHHPLPPLPLCAWRTHQNCLCPKYSRWLSTLLLRSRSLCSRDGAAFALVLAALGELRLWPLLLFEFMRPSLTTKTGNGTLPGGCVFFCCC